MPVYAGFELETELRNSPERRVYIARRLHDNKRVILKIIPLSESMRVEYERRGAEIQKTLKSKDDRVPAIVDVFDYENNFNIAVEFIPGQDLYDLIRNGDRLPPDQVAAMLGELLDSKKKWGPSTIHGDLTPTNIRFRSGGGIAVLDFGIAKATSTSTHNAMHTVPYCDPERVRHHQVSRATDLWSISVIAYQALAGHIPFPVTNGDVRFGKLPKIPGCPAGLMAILTKALSINARDRYQTPEEYLADLERFRTGAAPLTKRAPRWVFPAATALLAAVTGGFGYTRIPSDEKSRLEMGWQGIEKIPMPAVIRETAAQALRKRTRVLFQRALANYRLEVPRTNRAQWNELLALRRRLDPNLPTDLALIQIVEGHCLRLSHKSEQARLRFEKAVQLDPASMDPHIALSRLHAYNLIDPEKVEAAQRSSAARGHQHTRREPAELADALRAKAKTLVMFERAADLYRGLGGFGESKKHLAYCERRITWLRQRQSESEPRP